MNADADHNEPIRSVLGRRLALVSGFFFCLVAVMMLMNAMQLRRVHPLDTPALVALTEQLAANPDDALLRDQVRELDWLARRAFFVRQWQLESGTVLLIVSGVLFVFSLQLVGGAARMGPSACPGVDSPWAAASRARQGIVGTGLALLVVGGLVFLSGRRGGDALRRMPPSPPASDAREADDPATRSHAAAGGRDVDGSAAAGRGGDWPEAFNAQWPSFRGPRGLGLAPNANPPTDWDGASGRGIRWKVRVPRGGYNSPVVWGDRVFLTGADKTAREVYAFDAETGVLLWTAGTDGIAGSPVDPPAVTDDTGYAAPSVAVDGHRVVAIFGTGDVLGLDFEGRRLWGRNLGVPDNHYGHASSLLILPPLVYVQYDHGGGTSLIALDVETGREHWRIAREVDVSWASPILVGEGGRERVILAAAPTVTAHDARTGAILWSRDVLFGEVGASPAAAQGRVFIANQYAAVSAIDVETGAVLWSHSDRELPDAGSPVAEGNLLFMPTSYGPFSCFDAEDGRVIWEQEFDPAGYGSPVLADGRIYWVTEDGRTRIFQASDTFSLIGEPALGEPSVSTPAVVGNRLYIRGFTHLYCIGGD